jgi:hypothetical protein
VGTVAEKAGLPQLEAAGDPAFSHFGGLVATPAAMVDRAPQPAERVYTQADLEELLGGPRRTRQFVAKLARKLAEAKVEHQRVTAEFDPAGPGFAVHFNVREAL